MKKCSLFLFFAVALIIISCSKANNEESVIDTQKVQEVVTLNSNPGTMVVAFNILNPAEKAYAFTKHISDNYKKMELNDEQAKFVNKVISIITPELYKKGIENKFAGIIAALEYEATKLFSIKEYIYLFENIRTAEPTLNNPTALNNPTGPGDCVCRWDSYCQAYADTLGPDCIWGGCTETESGCGFLFLSSCKGKCGRIPA